MPKIYTRRFQVPSATLAAIVGTVVILLLTSPHGFDQHRPPVIPDAGEQGATPIYTSGIWLSAHGSFKAGRSTAPSCPGAQVPAVAQLLIPNFDKASPACRIRVMLQNASCHDERCVIPGPAGGGTMTLNLSCLPTWAPTGFEKPPDYASIFSLPNRNKARHGHYSLMDTTEPPSEATHEELNFCLYGKQQNLCGSTTMPKSRGTGSPHRAAILSLINRIELLEVPPR